MIGIFCVIPYIYFLLIFFFLSKFDTKYLTKHIKRKYIKNGINPNFVLTLCTNIPFKLYDLRFHGQEGQSTSCFSVSFLTRFMRVHVLYTVCTYIHFICTPLYVRYTYTIYNTSTY